MRLIVATVCLLFWLLATVAGAGEADVVKVAVEKIGPTYRFAVTVAHRDEGWEHYADKWEVIGPDGQVLVTRVLLHPHVEEQPFTRSLSGVEIGSEIHSVTVRAHDLVHGYGGREMQVELPR